MADWSKPSLSSTKSAFPGEVRDIAISAASQDYASDTNIPDSVMRYNRSSKKWQQRESGVWVDKELTGLADDAVTIGKLADDSRAAISDQTFVLCTDSGATNTKLLTAPAHVTAYTEGMKLVFKATATNTTAVTVNVNSLGAKQLNREFGSISLVGGEVAANRYYEIVYIGGLFVLLDSIAPMETSSSPTYGTDDAFYGTSSQLNGTPTTSYMKYSRLGGYTDVWMYFSFELNNPVDYVTVSLPISNNPLANTAVFPLYTPNGTQLAGFMAISSGTNTGRGFPLNGGVQAKWNNSSTHYCVGHIRMPN